MSSCPDFINIGPGRCASSWLLEVLDSHPSIQMARIKETEFFNTNFDKGIDWYQRLFADSAAAVTGEISNCYYTEPLVPNRIFEYKPDVKLIINLRNPFSLLSSFHGFGIRRGLPLTSVENDLAVPIGKIMGSGYDQREKQGGLNAGDTVSLLDAVLLSQHIEPFLKVFERQQIYFFVFERLKTEADEVVREIYRFLEVDDGFSPSVAKEVVNEAIIPKSRVLAKLAANSAFALRQVGAYGLLDSLKKSRLIKRLLFSTAAKSKKSASNLQQQLPAETCQLIEEDMQKMIALYPALGQWWNPMLGIAHDRR